MTLNSLSPMVTNVQLSGCPAKASLQVATHVPQLLHLSYWRPLAQIQSARRCATHRGGLLSVQASVTQTQTQDLAKSQKVMWQTLLLQPNIAANALQQAVMCVLCLDCRVKTCCSDRKQAFWQAFWLLQASPERVGDVMTKKHVWTCNPDTSIDDGQCCAYSSTLTVSCL